MIKNILWDLDGTLFDTYPSFTAAFQSALIEMGHDSDPDLITSLAQAGMVQCIRTLAENYKVEEENLERAFLDHYQMITYADQPLMAGARQICLYIQSIGGINVIVTHRGSQSANGLLDEHNLGELILDLISGDDGFPKKPDPASMEAIMIRNDLVPANTLAVGDRPLDHEAGRAAGLRTCLLGKLESQSSPDFRVDHLDKLLEIIQQDNLGLS